MTDTVELTSTEAAVVEAQQATQQAAQDFDEAKAAVTLFESEQDSSVLGSAKFIDARRKASEELEDAAEKLLRIRDHLAQAEAEHLRAKVAAYEELLPEIEGNLHQLAAEIDKELAALDSRYSQFIELSAKLATARKAADLSGPDILRTDRTLASHLIRHLPSIRSLRDPRTLVVYPHTRSALAEIYTPHEAKS